MEKTRPDVAMKELAMMLMYLSRIVEKGASMPYAWKGYDFQVLNDLDTDGCIDQGRYGTKRAYILDNEEGLHPGQGRRLRQVAACQVWNRGLAGMNRHMPDLSMWAEW